MPTDPPRGQGRFPIDPDAWRFITPFAAAGALGWAFELVWVWAPALVVIVAIGAFFRDPPRRGARIPGALWSPADGKVVQIDENEDPLRGPVPGARITIFLSVLNCHINRSPCAGTVEKIRYQRGRFLNALDPSSSEENEANWIFINAGRHRVTVRQIAGLIARRIVCRVREGQELRRGQRFGLIRFGSRTEIYVPAEAEVRVVVGQRVYGGRTVLAVMPE